MKRFKFWDPEKEEKTPYKFKDFLLHMVVLKTNVNSIDPSQIGNHVAAKIRLDQDFSVNSTFGGDGSHVVSDRRHILRDSSKDTSTTGHRTDDILRVLTCLCLPKILKFRYCIANNIQPNELYLAFYSRSITNKLITIACSPMSMSFPESPLLESSCESSKLKFKFADSQGGFLSAADLEWKIFEKNLYLTRIQIR